MSKHRTIPAGVYYPRPLQIPISTTPGMQYQFDSTDEPSAHGATIFRARSQDRAQLVFGKVDLVLRIGFHDETGREWDIGPMLDWLGDAIDRFEEAFESSEG